MGILGSNTPQVGKSGRVISRDRFIPPRAGVLGFSDDTLLTRSHKSHGHGATEVLKLTSGNQDNPHSSEEVFRFRLNIKVSCQV